MSVSKCNHGTGPLSPCGRGTGRGEKVLLYYDFIRKLRHHSTYAERLFWQQLGTLLGRPLYINICRGRLFKYQDVKGVPYVL